MTSSSLPSPSHSNMIKPPVVILAGGCDSSVQNKMDLYRALLIRVFSSFSGTILSGGTSFGIAGLATDICLCYPNQITGIGYLPRNEKPDPRLDHIVFTSGLTFSAIEPLWMWSDIIAAGISPETVCLLGINGGVISEMEYRIALAMNARVGLLKGSGRAVDVILNDARYNGFSNIFPLSFEPEDIHNFLCWHADR